MSLLLLATAVQCWPAGAAARRLAAVRRSARPRRRIPRPSGVTTLAVLAALAWAAAGPGVAAAALLVGRTLAVRWRARNATRRRARAVEAMVEALSLLVTELRTGAHPARAAEAVAAECRPPAAEALRAVATATLLGGDVPHALARVGEQVPALAGPITQLCRAWVLVHRHGLPLADVLDAVRADLDHRRHFAARVRAHLAGPRSSATVLALLPLAGLALGEAMGAHPLRVLTEGAGQILLLLGCGLGCAGVRWSARLTEQPVPR